MQEVGTSLREGQIYDVNSYTLLSVISKNGGKPKKHKAVPDNLKDIEEAVK
ncbi:MAG: molybdenum cofactor biosynthesis protein, partial [Desulfobacterales bacterium]|nr:molybdenum cofactor biosynthesis protein [Desulfobacterales bacterium]